MEIRAFPKWKMGWIWCDLCRNRRCERYGGVLQLALRTGTALVPLGSFTCEPYGFHQSVLLSVSDLKCSFE